MRRRVKPPALARTVLLHAYRAALGAPELALIVMYTALLLHCRAALRAGHKPHLTIDCTGTRGRSQGSGAQVPDDLLDLARPPRILSTCGLPYDGRANADGDARLHATMATASVGLKPRPREGFGAR